ncbi:glycosyltransferase [Enterococcus faecium]
MKSNTVTILLSTYNGEKYLVEQIESLIAQKDVEVNILVRDDGSTDATKKILSKYEKFGLIKWYTGKKLGPA